MLARMMNEFAPLFQLHGQMNRLFEDGFDDLPAARPYGTGYPALNVWEDGDVAWAECELPGLGMDDVEVLVTGNQLVLNGQRKLADVADARWYRRERSQGRFSRAVELPWDIDADRVEARLADGVLTIKLPKCESCKPKKVKVLTA